MLFMNGLDGLKLEKRISYNLPIKTSDNTAQTAKRTNEALWFVLGTLGVIEGESKKKVLLKNPYLIII